MAQDVTVKVRIDTQSAKQDLRKLGREGQASAGRVNERLNRKSGGLGGGLAAGAGFGAGLGALTGAVRGAAAGPLGDVFGETTAFGRALFDETIGGASARATKSTRDEAAQKFAFSAGVTGDTSNAKQWQAAVLPNRLTVAEGAVSIQKDLAPGTEEVKEMARSFGDRLMEAVGDGFDKLIESLSGERGR